MRNYKTSRHFSKTAEHIHIRKGLFAQEKMFCNFLEMFTGCQKMGDEGHRCSFQEHNSIYSCLSLIFSGLEDFFFFNKMALILKSAYCHGVIFYES